ncbi:hypothetical protein CesoFtcFv8_027670 [Champsocephalus esox]|uniref:Uncharacterized protein n=1 Tax=Champsocephalus esox TaxID=159716 RepID=A0AAN8ATY3_9TELE|nr:hypothetical protein CesoFtcFv8_027670 [Champsocephalus esox]
MHNARANQSLAALLSATLPTLAPVERKTNLVFPLWSAPVSPVLTAWADPHLPPASSPTPATPPCSASPPEAWLSSDLERHRHLPKAAVLPEKVELSQSPCGVQPSVPLFLWFSLH